MNANVVHSTSWTIIPFWTKIVLACSEHLLNCGLHTDPLCGALFWGIIHHFNVVIGFPFSIGTSIGKYIVGKKKSPHYLHRLFYRLVFTTWTGHISILFIHLFSHPYLFMLWFISPWSHCFNVINIFNITFTGLPLAFNCVYDSSCVYIDCRGFRSWFFHSCLILRLMPEYQYT